MKKSVLAAFALATLTAMPALAEDKKTMMTVLTAADAQTQLMAMVLTMNAAQQGVATRILLCGPAGDIALKAAPETATAGQPPKGASPQGLMQMMMAKTATKVEVCAIYLPGKGVAADALLDGITAANPAEAAMALVADDTTVLSF